MLPGLSGYWVMSVGSGGIRCTARQCPGPRSLSCAGLSPPTLWTYCRHISSTRASIFSICMSNSLYRHRTKKLCLCLFNPATGGRTCVLTPSSICATWNLSRTFQFCRELTFISLSPLTLIITRMCYWVLRSYGMRVFTDLGSVG